MLITPYNLGETQLVENSSKINIDKMLRKAKSELKLLLLKSQIEAMGIKVGLTTSKTRFNGERYWFVCPKCSKRIGTIYLHPVTKVVGCRKCLKLKYRAQRFKGMIEVQPLPVDQALGSL